MKAALLCAGIVAPGPRTPLAELMDAASFLVATGRAPHPRRWVDALIARDREARAARLPGHLC